MNRNEAWNKLDSLVGLQHIRELLRDMIRYKQSCGISKFDSMVFAGPPGTGKTEVAKLMSSILHAEGVLKTDRFICASPDIMKGSGVGETEKKVRDLCEAALDGVLFVDEAHTMVDEDGSYKDKLSEIAYTTIMRFMTEHKDRIMVIFAGYESIMEVFRKANPGIVRRVKVINFEPYSDDELYEILLLRAHDKGTIGNRINVVFSDVFSEEIKHGIAVMRKKMGNSFGNASSMETLLDECIAQAGRRLPKDIIMERGVTLTLEVEDIPDVFREMKNQGDNPIASNDNTVDMFCRLPAQMLSALPNPDLGVVSSYDYNGYCATATVLVKNSRGKGTAFIITPDGYAITCAHVVAGKRADDNPDQGIVIYSDYYNDPLVESKILADDTPRTFPYRVISVHKELDLALIRIFAKNPLSYLKLAAVGTKIKRGTRATLYGHLNGEPDVKSYECVVTSREIERNDGGLGTIMELQTNSCPGDSGGPVVSEETGLVIGVLQGTRMISIGENEMGYIVFMKPVDYFWKEFTQ